MTDELEWLDEIGLGLFDGETISPKRRRGRPRNPPINEAHRSLARSKGWRVTKRSDGWAVVSPRQYAYGSTDIWPNAWRAWDRAYQRSLEE